jgi:hypothetical protein
LIASLAQLAGWLALAPQDEAPRYALSAVRTAGAVVFDTDDEAWVEVLAVDTEGAEVLFHSEGPDDKAALATGDGRFRVIVGERPVLVVAAVGALADVDAVMAVSRDLDDARERLQARYADAAVVAVR